MDNKSFEPDFILTDRKISGKISNNNDISASAPTSDKHVDAASVVGLKREVGLVSGINLILGIIIGSGIFVSPGGLLDKSGSVGLSLLVWAGCGVLSTLGAFAYIELGTVVPASGAEYAYLLAAFGPIPAFLFSWISTIVLKPSGVAIICLSFAQYSIRPFLPLLGIEGNFDDPSLKWAQILICASALLLVTYINCASVPMAMKINNYFTGAKLIALGIIICCGIYNLSTWRVGLLTMGFEGSRWAFGPIAGAFYSGLWAFDGWNSLNYITEEIKNPYRNLPLAILIALPVVTAIYLFVNVSYFTVLVSFDEMINEPVAMVFGDRMLGPVSWLMPLAVAISTFASANGSQFTSGRLCYAASRQGHLVEVLSYIDVKRNTPSLAMVFNAAIAIIMAIALDIEGLIDFFSFTAWIFYGGAMAALIRLRYTKPDAPRPFQVPIFIPIIVLLISVYLVIAPVIEAPKVEYLYAIGFILIGFVVYFPFCHYKVVVPGMGKLTGCMQLLFLVAPPEADPDDIMKGSTKGDRF